MNNRPTAIGMDVLDERKVDTHSLVDLMREEPLRIVGPEPDRLRIALNSGLRTYFTSRGPSARAYSFSWTTPSLRATSV